MSALAEHFLWWQSMETHARKVAISQLDPDHAWELYRYYRAPVHAQDRRARPQIVYCQTTFGKTICFFPLTPCVNDLLLTLLRSQKRN